MWATTHRFEREVLPSIFGDAVLTRFFNARPTVLGDIVSTISNSMSFSESNRNVQQPRPSGGLLQAMVMSFASFSPSRILGVGGFSLCFLQRGFKSFLHKSFANVIHRLEVAMKIVGYFLVRFLRFIFVGI
jgi:hypothetical protein